MNGQTILVIALTIAVIYFIIQVEMLKFSLRQFCNQMIEMLDTVHKNLSESTREFEEDIEQFIYEEKGE